MSVRSSSDFQAVSALPTLCSLQSECFEELTWPCSGLWQLDIKDLDLGGCGHLDMDSTLERIALNFKNIEKLNIAVTNVTVLTEGD